MRYVLLLVLASCSSGPRPTPQRRAPEPTAPTPSPASTAQGADPVDAGSAPPTTSFQVDKVAAAACKERLAKLPTVDSFKPDYAEQLKVARCFFEAGTVGAAITLWQEVAHKARSYDQQLEAAEGMVEGYERANLIQPGQFIYNLADAREAVVRVLGSQVIRKDGSDAKAISHLERALCLRIEIGTGPSRDSADKIAKRLEHQHRRAPLGDLNAFCAGKRAE